MIIVDTQKVSALQAMAAAYNPRRISDHDLAALRRSLRTFGAVQPVVANRTTQRIVGGHQRVRAAHLEGIAELPVIWVDLDEVQERQLNLALNRVQGEWDEELLSGLLAELERAGTDLEITGFLDDEIEQLLDHAGERSVGLVEPDDAPPAEDQAHARVGDVVRLGDHLVLCGEAVELMRRHTRLGAVDLLITDPPYNVDLGSKGREVANDALSTEAFAAMLEPVLLDAAIALAPGAAAYVFMSSQEWPLVDRLLRSAGLHWSSTLIWAKDRAVLTRKDYHAQFEPIWYGWRDGAPRRHPLESRKQSDLWSFERPFRSADHPTMKPVSLLTRAVHNSSGRGDLVLDPFLGSGSTLIACEMLGRRCIGAEIEPRYVDVTVRRWQRFTGRQAEGWRGNDVS